jgi:hypothetical protein
MMIWHRICRISGHTPMARGEDDSTAGVINVPVISTARQPWPAGRYSLRPRLAWLIIRRLTTRGRRRLISDDLAESEAVFGWRPDFSGAFTGRILLADRKFLRCIAADGQSGANSPFSVLGCADWLSILSRLIDDGSGWLECC